MGFVDKATFKNARAMFLSKLDWMGKKIQLGSEKSLEVFSGACPAPIHLRLKALGYKATKPR